MALPDTVRNPRVSAVPPLLRKMAIRDTGAGVSPTVTPMRVRSHRLRHVTICQKLESSTVASMNA